MNMHARAGYLYVGYKKGIFRVNSSCSSELVAGQGPTSINTMLHAGETADAKSIYFAGVTGLHANSSGGLFWMDPGEGTGPSAIGYLNFMTSNITVLWTTASHGQCPSAYDAAACAGTVYSTGAASGGTAGNSGSMAVHDGKVYVVAKRVPKSSYCGPCIDKRRRALHQVTDGEAGAYSIVLFTVPAAGGAATFVAAFTKTAGAADYILRPSSLAVEAVGSAVHVYAGVRGKLVAAPATEAPVVMPPIILPPIMGPTKRRSLLATGDELPSRIVKVVITSSSTTVTNFTTTDSVIAVTPRYINGLAIVKTNHGPWRLVAQIQESDTTRYIASYDSTGTEMTGERITSVSECVATGTRDYPIFYSAWGKAKGDGTYKAAYDT
eukprot:tig00001038_g6542.t1